MPKTGTKSKRKTSKKEKILQVTLVKSPIGYDVSQKRTVKALGFRKLHQTIEHTDSPAIRGMLTKITHLIQVEEKES